MALKVGTYLPSLADASLWVSESFEPDEGRPILVHFWAISCPFCKSNLQELQRVQQQYTPLGLRSVAIHTPRSEADTNIEQVKSIAAELGLTEPCAIDNDHTLADRFQTEGVWPIYFVFDRQNKLKRRGIGNFGIRTCESVLQQLFGDVEGEKPN